VTNGKQVELLIARTEEEVRRNPLRDDARLLWLSAEPVPTSLRHAVPECVGNDPTATDTWRWLKVWAGEAGEKGSIKEILEYKGTSLWWLSDHWMYCGNSLPNLLEITRFAHRLHQALAVWPNLKIVLLTGSSTDDSIARCFANHLNLPYEWKRPLWERGIQRHRERVRVRNTFALRLAKLFVRAGFAHVFRDRRHATEPLDLVINTSSSSFEVHSGIDRIIQALLCRVRERRLKVGVLHMDFTRSVGWNTVLALPTDFVIWESFLDWSMLKAAHRTSSVVRANKPRKLPGEISGIPVTQILRDRIDSLLSYRVFDAVIAFELAHRALEVLRPKCVYVVDEYDMWGRALVTTAKRMGIRTIAIQHGAIDANHEGYFHLPTEISADGRDTFPHCPLADITAVYGERWKRILLEHGHYPVGSVEVTGSLPLEFALQNLPSRELARRTLGLAASDFVVAYFGTPENIHPADRSHLDAVLWVCGCLHLKLVLKPHPIDQRGYTRYSKAVRRANVHAVVVDEGNPWAILAASDVVVSHNSTVALDALALGRPHINLNLSGDPDIYPYVADRLSMGAYSRQEFLETVLALRAPEAAETIGRALFGRREEIFSTIERPSEALLRLGGLGAE